MPIWQLDDDDGLIPALLAARPELKPDLDEWLRLFGVNPYDLLRTFPENAPRAIGKTTGWWFPVRPFLFEIVMDEDCFGTLTAITRVSTRLWDRVRP